MIGTRQQQKDNIVRKTERSLMEYDNNWAVKLRLHEGLDGMNE